jgi:hypothetical protein
VVVEECKGRVDRIIGSRERSKEKRIDHSTVTPGSDICWRRTIKEAARSQAVVLEM